MQNLIQRSHGEILIQARLTLISDQILQQLFSCVRGRNPTCKAGCLQVQGNPNFTLEFAETFGSLGAACTQSAQENPCLQVLLAGESKTAGEMYSDRLSLNGTGSKKRSVKDRLGISAQNGEEQSRSSKRFQGTDGKWRHDMYDDTSKTRLTAKDEQLSTQDLRFKLQKNVSRGAQGGSNNEGFGGMKDLREKLSGPLPPPRAHTQAVSMPQQGSSSVMRAASSSVTRAPAVKPSAAAIRPPAPAVKSSAPVAKPPVPAVKPPMPFVKPPSASKVATGAGGMTVASFLQSLDLSKYSITFQAEEIDMSILRLMKDDELKELGIPMGPRKKISLALAAQSKH